MEDTENLLIMDICESRAKKYYLYEICYSITRSVVFEIIIAMCIVLNTVVLALDSYPIDV